MTIEAIGSMTIEAIDSRLLQGLGFSNGWAEFGPKKPPPFVPACLIATRAATGPRAIVWVSNFVAAPSSVAALAAAVEGHRHAHADEQARRRPGSTGRRTNQDAAHQVDVEVAQVLVPRSPRRVASITQRPEAGVTNISQTMQASWLKYERCCSPE